FPVGQRAVIDGWDLAVPLINQGGSATLFIPSTLAYGATPRPGPIPPNAILMFDVEVVQVKSN
ncbi:MAG: FKBP-type peptidyl-prolyl cis-trans isomerase, partial [Candidatus Endobugula sp.]